VRIAQISEGKPLVAPDEGVLTAVRPIAACFFHSQVTVVEAVRLTIQKLTG
jgi:hypothetical protein